MQDSKTKIREDLVISETKRIRFGCSNVYCTVGCAAGKPVQILMQAGKAGCCQKTLLEGICRLANKWLDANMPLEEIISCLVGLRCDQGMAGAGRLSCADALGQMLKGYTIKDTETEEHP